MRRYTLTMFQKMLLLLVLVLVPVVVIFAYSNAISVRVVEEETRKSSYNQLDFLRSQMETAVNQLAAASITQLRNPSALEYAEQFPTMDLYSSVKAKEAIERELFLFSNASVWNENTISVWYASLDQLVTTDSRLRANPDAFALTEVSRWLHRGGEFVRTQTYISEAEPEIFVQVAFSDWNVIRMLDQHKAGGVGDPFLYRTGQAPVYNSSPNRLLITETMRYMDTQEKGDTVSNVVNLQGQSYLVNAVRVPSLDWYLVDVIPLGEMLVPIEESRNVFYVSTAIALLLGIIAALYLYRTVQLPIVKLIRSLQRVQEGDLTTRLSPAANGSEFAFVFERFNDMAGEMQRLIEKVYAEEIRSREAVMKQLQSQINPHFLYNTFYTIYNLTESGDKEAVKSMVISLGEYYRYTTRLEQALAPLSEEVQLIRSYLTIQQLRLHRFTFDIHIPENMMPIELPRLILQPIVENAIEHGIEPKEGFGKIEVTGFRDDISYGVCVEDNGQGLSEEALDKLRADLLLPVRRESGYGVWNVNQRLLTLYGPGAGVSFEHARGGGLRVTLRWRAQSQHMDQGGDQP